MPGNLAGAYELLPVDKALGYGYCTPLCPIAQT
jgi:hypothetical protein